MVLVPPVLIRQRLLTQAKIIELSWKKRAIPVEGIFYPFINVAQISVLPQRVQNLRCSFHHLHGISEGQRERSMTSIIDHLNKIQIITVTTRVGLEGTPYSGLKKDKNHQENILFFYNFIIEWLTSQQGCVPVSAFPGSTASLTRIKKNFNNIKSHKHFLFLT